MTTKRRARKATSGRTGPDAVPANAMKRFLQAIEDQVSPGVAAVRLGVTKSTVYRWLEDGEAAKSGAKREFWEKVTRARDEGLCDRAGDFRRHSKKDYRATVEILSRRDPENWGSPGRRAKLEHEQAMHEQELRRATAAADMAEAKAAIVAAAVKGEGRGVVLTPVDLLPLLPEEMREPFKAALAEHGLALMVLRELADELDEALTEAEMMDATGLGPGGASPEAG